MTATTFWSASSAAQSDEDRAGARSLATEGARAYQEQRWSEAIDLFTRAESLLHAPPHLLYIARASVQAGQLVRARESYMRIVRDPIAPNAPAAFRDAQEAAKQELPALEPRIPSLTVKVKGTHDNLALSVDGKSINTALIGVPRPTDPGEHTIRATAAGMASELTKVVLKEGARETIVLELLPSKDAPKAGAVETPVATEPSLQPTVPAGDSGGGNGLRIASYAALGVGVVGVGVGTLFALKSASARSDADELCPDAARCPSANRAEIEKLDDDAASAKSMATVGFIAGGVGIATGVTLFLLSGSRKEAAPATAAFRVQPWLGYRSAGLSGTF